MILTHGSSTFFDGGVSVNLRFVNAYFQAYRLRN